MGAGVGLVVEVEVGVDHGLADVHSVLGVVGEVGVVDAALRAHQLADVVGAKRPQVGEDPARPRRPSLPEDSLTRRRWSWQRLYSSVEVRLVIGEGVVGVVPALAVGGDDDGTTVSGEAVWAAGAHPLDEEDLAPSAAASHGSSLIKTALWFDVPC